MMFTITNVFSYIQATNETTERKKAERNYFFLFSCSFFFSPWHISDTQLGVGQDHHTEIRHLVHASVTSCHLMLRNTAKINVHVY